MTKEDQFRRFGAFLRSARKQRGLTLKQVAEASRRIVPHPDGAISHPYLSQIETGKTTNVSLPKVLTLAALYGRQAEQVIEQAPDELRAALVSAWGDWRAANRHEPQAMAYLPELVLQCDSDFDELLARFSRNVRIPFGREQGARRLIRWAIRSAVLSPLLYSAPLAARFWAEGNRLSSWAGEGGTCVWEGIVRACQDWVFYGCGLAPQVVPLIRAWTVRPHQEDASLDGRAKLSCAFVDPDLDAQFGFENVPIVAVWAVRWRQSACLLAPSAPPSLELPLAPDPLDGLLDYVTQLAQSDSLPVLHPGMSPKDLSRHLRALVEQIPALKGAGPRRSDARDAEPIAAFFASAKAMRPRAGRRETAG